MTTDLEAVKRSAPRLASFGEWQIITESADGFKLYTHLYHMGTIAKRFNGEMVIAYRCFTPTDYAHDQQGEWQEIK